MQSLLDSGCRERLLARLRGLSPGAPPHWGRMTAPRMLAHLCDSLRHMLGETRIASHPSALRWPLVRHIVMYWLPWPKGRIKGAGQLFLSPPGSWNGDLNAFEDLLLRFVGATTRTDWPEHPFFGPMSHRAWGRFAHRHFDHHLRQFGA